MKKNLNILSIYGNHRCCYQYKPFKTIFFVMCTYDTNSAIQSKRTRNSICGICGIYLKKSHPTLNAKISEYDCCCFLYFLWKQQENNLYSFKFCINLI